MKGPQPSILGFGNTVELFAGIGDKNVGGTKWGKEYGEMYGIFSMVFTPVLIINDPVIVREVSVKKFSIFTTRGRNRLNNAFGKLAPKERFSELNIQFNFEPILAPLLFSQQLEFPIRGVENRLRLNRL